MTTGSLVEPEFVVHLFAPLDGPDAAEALAGLQTLWENCRTQLGMTQPIVETRLPADLPADPACRPDGALAGLQDPAVQFQAIARREHDVLNFSFAIASLEAVPRSRLRLGSSLPPGWFEFHRWWRALGAGTALLGAAIVLLAKSPDPDSVDVRRTVPTQDDDAQDWWTSGFTLRTFSAWETTPAGTHGSRRLVLLAKLDEDIQLSRFAWSDGGTALPPLGRYLMHAAKLRYLARVRDGGGELDQLRQRVAGLLDELTGMLTEPGGAARASSRAQALVNDQVDLAFSLERLRHMRRSVEIAQHNMATILEKPLPADASLGGWLAAQLAHDTEFLDATRERAERLRAILDPPLRHATDTPPPNSPPPNSPPPDPPPVRIEYRVAFGIEIVDYRARTTPSQRQVERRLAGMIERILTGIGLPLYETDRQAVGERMVVVLPASVQPDIALTQLLHGCEEQVLADDAAHPDDRIRLRLSVGSGMLSQAAPGFGGEPITQVVCLLDSGASRQAALDRQDADLVAIVADRLYEDVVEPGYSPLRAEQFAPIETSTRAYKIRAWLWSPAARTRGGQRLRSAGHSGAPSVSRDVFVIHGEQSRSRRDMFELLRAIDLNPLGWDDMVTRTGKANPYPEEVFTTAFGIAPGVLVVLTPDDSSDRLVVPYRTGRAQQAKPDQTIIVEIGQVASTPDLNGRQTVRLIHDTPDQRTIFQYQVVQRLRNVGYPAVTDGTDWLNPGRFRGLVEPDTYTDRRDDQR